MSRLLLGVTGGIAAYKALELVRLAIGAGHRVRVVQTPSSERFVGRASFEGLTGAPVLVSEFEPDPARGAFPGDPPPSHAPVSHLELVANADAYLVAPASANTIAKLAHGHADGLLSTAALAAACPVLVAPAMNNRMYEHPATQANLATLRARGVTVVPPGTGALASEGEWGVGRLAEPPALLAAVEQVLGVRGRAGVSGPWDGLSVLVTAGGTREPIDSVRYIGNRSSGRMGFALAREAAARGADVTVIAAEVALEREPGVAYVDVGTTEQLRAACEARFGQADVLLMAAAVADFKPAVSVERKLKKDEDAPHSIELEPTPDVLAGLAASRRPGQVLVGFAAEHGEGAVAYGRRKLTRKGLDVVVVNDISRHDIGFDTAANEVTIVTREDETLVPRTGKDRVAAAVLDTVSHILGAAASVHRPDARAPVAPGVARADPRLQKDG